MQRNMRFYGLAPFRAIHILVYGVFAFAVRNSKRESISVSKVGIVTFAGLHFVSLFALMPLSLPSGRGAFDAPLPLLRTAQSESAFLTAASFWAASASALTAAPMGCTSTTTSKILPVKALSRSS
jgi:hypothetical protein